MLVKYKTDKIHILSGFLIIVVEICYVETDAKKGYWPRNRPKIKNPQF